MDNSQIENTNSEIRKRSSAVTSFVHKISTQDHASDRQNHSIDKWDFGENNHQNNHIANWSENTGSFLLNEHKIQGFELNEKKIQSITVMR